MKVSIKPHTDSVTPDSNMTIRLDEASPVALSLIASCSVVAHDFTIAPETSCVQLRGDGQDL